MIELAQTFFEAPDVDYAGFSPIIALTAGTVVVLLAGLVGPRGNRWLSSILTLLTLAITAGLMIWRLGEPDAGPDRGRAADRRPVAHDRR